MDIQYIFKAAKGSRKKHYFFSGAARRSLCQYSYFEINKKRLKKNNSLETILQKNNDISNLYIYIYMGNYFLDIQYIFKAAKGSRKKHYFFSGGNGNGSLLCVQEVVTPIYIISYYINWGNYFLDTRYFLDRQYEVWQLFCIVN